ncbi:MAG: F510_1955 family glycosylhydrolase [Nitrospirota bacterium]
MRIGKIIFLLFLAIFLFKNLNNAFAEEKLPLTHIHGIAVNPDNPDTLYVGTHFGLLLCDSKECELVGDDRSDYMGFNISTDGKTFYTSGHQQPTGKNRGLRRSLNRGKTWEMLSLDGEVDFHSLTANPSVIYGWYWKLYKSTDDGKSWTFPDAKGLPPKDENKPSPYSPIISLAIDPADSNILWAGTNKGLYKSSDDGANWKIVNAVSDAPVLAIYINPDNKKEMYLSLFKEGILKSTDGEKDWSKAGKGINENDVIGYFAASPKDRKIIYAATYKTTIYRSTNGGKSWTVWRR